MAQAANESPVPAKVNGNDINPVPKEKNNADTNLQIIEQKQPLRNGPENKDIMTFADIFYKCTLCRSAPSIMTSQEDFRLHMRTEHFPKNGICPVMEGHTCDMCKLMFNTQEDYQHHVTSIHPVADISTELQNDSVKNKPQEKTASLSHSKDMDTNSKKDGIYNSVGAGSCETSLNDEDKKRSPTVPKNTEARDTKQNISYVSNSIPNRHICLNSPEKGSAIASKYSGKFPQTSSESLSRLQELTDQIMASSLTVTGKRQPGSDVKTGHVKRPLPAPGFTLEFGKYTKLVREGGNIVYFCQVCNWKSPSKPDFQTHCAGNAHRGKLNLLIKNGEICNSSPGSREDPDDISCTPKCPNPVKDPRVLPYSQLSRAVLFGSGFCSSYNNLLGDLQMQSGQNESPLNLSDRSDSQRKAHVDEETSSGRISIDKEASSNRVTELQSKSVKAEADAGMEYPEGGDKQTNHRRRRKRPAPVMVRNPPRDGKYDWSDCGSSTGSDVDESPETENGKRKRFVDEKDSLLLDVEYSSEGELKTKIFQNTPTNEENLDSNSADSIHYRSNNGDTMTTTANRVSPNAESDIKINGTVNETRNTNIAMKIKQEADFSTSLCMLEKPCEENGDSGDSDGTKSSNGEGWKIIRMKEVLSDVLCESSKGNIPRDLLLQKISHLLQWPEVVHWGSACNRAVREEFPTSIAQRKGKFKKTYFFGVQFSEQTTEIDHVTEGEYFSFQPLRDMSLDTEKILRHLPDLVCWTGDMEYGVSRDELLQLLSEPIADVNVLVWGIECNRAVRKLYPDVHTKRKGKYKTVFYGLSYLPHVRQEHLSNHIQKQRLANPAEISSSGQQCYGLGQNNVGSFQKVELTDLHGNDKHFENSEQPQPLDLNLNSSPNAEDRP